jgi:hypothetical protein
MMAAAIHPSLLFVRTDRDFVWALEHAANLLVMFMSTPTDDSNILVIIITYMGESSLFIKVLFLELYVLRKINKAIKT